jgi:CBS domain-containing protein
MRIRDIMSRPVFTVWPTDPVEGAAALLADREIAAVPVVDERNRLVGMVSEVDLLRARIPARRAASTMSRARRRPHIVAEVMSRAVIIAQPQQDVVDVARTMLERDVRSVPVLDEGRLVGIVSRRDVLRAVLSEGGLAARSAPAVSLTRLTVRVGTPVRSPRCWSSTVPTVQPPRDLDQSGENHRLRPAVLRTGRT